MKTQLRQLSEAFERLSAKDQTLSILLMGFILCGVFIFGEFLMGRNIQTKERAIQAKSTQIREAGTLQADYRRRLDEQKRLAEQIEANQSTRILSYLDKLRKESRIDLKDATERADGKTGSDLIKEESAKVTIRGVSLDRLFDFLQRIEQGNPLVKVRRLEMKSNFEDKSMLDADITVSTYKMVKN